MAKNPKLPDSIDWHELRKRSLSPGGFGEERKLIWPKLLHVGDSGSQPSNDPETSESHRDEYQIRLDTDRSFVLYPVAVPGKSREFLQEDLHQLLVSVFRRRPRLHYFQGYHDIITVLFLTLPPEMQLLCAEKLSLHRVRDSMGSTLEPVVGLLKFMKSLIKAVDPEFSAILEEGTPLPYFALSNLLTLFSHDMPTLPLIQHVFDYLLCRPPIMIVYLAVAVTLSRKQEVQRLQEEGEEGMLHSLLTGLPHFTDEDQTSTSLASQPEQPEVKSEEVSPPTNHADGGENSIDEEAGEGTTLIDTDDTSPIDTSQAEDTLVKEEDQGPVEPKAEDQRLDGDSQAPSQEEPTSTTPEEGDSTSQTSLESLSQSHQEAKTQKPATALSTLLQHSDTLYEQYPPNHSSLKLKLSDVMGPQSVVFTWSENEKELPSDDTAERMVDYPQLVVYPVDDTMDEDDKEGEEESDTEEHTEKGRRRRNKLDRKTMVAGAVLVLSVAMAVYGVRYGAIGDGRGNGNGFSKEWKKIGAWVGGVLAGTGDKLLHLI
ncbi:tbc1 domain member 20 [Moniliophthora roreri MCA 2997]|uniref:Tbc1 domain member 20 n=1 Tax=Moniliophthora roreri (strain MCA 2997) TaxID=1381753 RepID=V2X400_MONRO|nr:tbc1 domain member 20 [Moniliophthora roreri MCA 2997]